MTVEHAIDDAGATATPRASAFAYSRDFHEEPWLELCGILLIINLYGWLHTGFDNKYCWALLAVKAGIVTYWAWGKHILPPHESSPRPYDLAWLAAAGEWLLTRTGVAVAIAWLVGYTLIVVLPPSPKGAMRAVLTQTEAARITQPTTVAAILQKLERIDLGYCPPDFAEAYLQHLNAWQHAARVETTIASHEEDMHSVATYVEASLRAAAGDPFGTVADRAADARVLTAKARDVLEEIQESRARIEQIAARYGVVRRSGNW